jgi:hypothetical protein
MPTAVSRERLRLFRRRPLGSDRSGRLTLLATRALAGLGLLLCQPAIAGSWRTASNEPAVRFDFPPAYRWHGGPTLGAQPMQRLNTSFRVPPPFDAGLTLSPVEQRVSEIASRNGDRDYLMVNKNRGRIILFERGRPAFSRPALTGESMADHIPMDAWRTPWSKQSGVKFKVTPAGRFTITRSYDRKFGELFDINELQGRDWTIAIHRVWLGKPAERRDARLRSEMDDDKHITNGCIDVEPGTMAQLLRILPSRGMPLYILPNNENLVSNVFEVGLRRTGPRG